MNAADRGDRWYSGESVLESARRLGTAPAYAPNLTIPDDGLVVIPAALAAEVADEGNEQELKERFIRGLVQQGVPTSECYPPNADVLRQYADWKRMQ